jgi:hypothetical protein
MSALFAPLWGVVFALGGAGLAWVWHFYSWLLAVAIAFGIAGLGLMLEAIGRQMARTAPRRAIPWLECWAISVGAMTAAAAAIGILIGVNLTVDGALATDTGSVKLDKNTTKAIVAAVATSLAAFVTSLSVTSEKVDTALGGRIRKTFQEFFKGPGTPAADVPRGGRILPAGSEGLRAVYSLFDPPDWDHDNRRLRAERLQEHLSPPPGVSPAPGPQATPTQ